jgi:hypothetical protein
MIGRAVHRPVVADHDLAILGGVHVELDGARAVVNRAANREEC